MSLASNISALENKKEALGKAEEKCAELRKEIAQLQRDIASELGITASASAGNGKRGRRSSSSTQAELSIVKDAVLKILKAEKEKVGTMALSQEIKTIVPAASDTAIARAKLELKEAGEIKQKGEKRGAQYYV